MVRHGWAARFASAGPALCLWRDPPVRCTTVSGHGDTDCGRRYHARWWRERSLTIPEDPDGQNYCVAPIDKVLEAIAHFDLGQHAQVIGGWFNETLPKYKPERIAVLRVDCDWYDPCMIAYRELEPLVSVGAPVIIDDYDAWEGCRLATHAYLTKHALPWKIRSIQARMGRG